MKILECSSKGDKRFSAFFAYVEIFGKNTELVEFAKQYDDFNDIFKGKDTINCQADSIRKYIKQGRDFIIEENYELLNEIKYNNKFS